MSTPIFYNSNRKNRAKTPGKWDFCRLPNHRPAAHHTAILDLSSGSRMPTYVAIPVSGTAFLLYQPKTEKARQIGKYPGNFQLIQLV
ncbi:MAG TPA: hypothetical protein IAC40_02065 [Candidatus Faecivivens stercorigallinarum]|nr:hypothetical protein [Candidatus Faecivivens stercorigallinarum]